MAPPLVTFLNSTEVRIEWNEDAFHKGGPIKDYEIRVSYQKTGHNHTFRAKPLPGKSVVTVGLDRISAEQVIPGRFCYVFLPVKSFMNVGLETLGIFQVLASCNLVCNGFFNLS